MPEHAAKATESLEKELLHALRFSGLEKENLNELVRIVVDLNRGGLQQLRVFPKGIPVVDGLQVQAVIESSRLANILNRILIETPRLTGVSVFPYGIPNPEIFHVNVELGETVQARPLAARAAITA